MAVGIWIELGTNNERNCCAPIPVIDVLRQNFLGRFLDKKAAHCVEESRGRTYPKNTKSLVYIFSLVVTGLWSGVYSTNAQVNVTQFHNHDSRDGLYIDSAFTPGAAANLARDLNFDGTISGLVYAQPLYIDNGPGGRPTIIAVTESNNVYALDAVDGSVIWQRDVGDPVFQDDLACQGQY